MEGLAEAFADNILLKKFKNMDPTTKRFSLTERNAHGTLSASKQISGEKTNQANQHGPISEKNGTSSSAPGRSFRRDSREGMVIIGDGSSMRVTAPEGSPVGQDVEVKDSDTDDLDPM